MCDGQKRALHPGELSVLYLQSGATVALYMRDALRSGRTRVKDPSHCFARDATTPPKEARARPGVPRSRCGSTATAAYHVQPRYSEGAHALSSLCRSQEPEQPAAPKNSSVSFVGRIGHQSYILLLVPRRSRSVDMCPSDFSSQGPYSRGTTTCCANDPLTQLRKIVRWSF